MSDAEIAETAELAAVRADVAMGRAILPSVACRVLAFLDRRTAERDEALAARANDVAVLAAAMRLRPEWLAEDVSRAADEWKELSAHHDQHHHEERLLRERIAALTAPHDTEPCAAPESDATPLDFIARGRTDSAEWRSLPEDDRIDAIYRAVDTALDAGRFADVDATLDALDVAKMPAIEQLAYLTITLAASKSLKRRAAYGIRVRKSLDAEYGWNERNELLRGLL